MIRARSAAALLAGLLACPAIAAGDDFDEALALFRQSAASGAFFERCHGYAVFPRVGKAAFGVGGASGRGRVYVAGRHVGNATLTQLSLGFSLGLQSFREIVFFEDERAFREFTAGGFEFGADASLVFVRAGASASAGTQGASAGIGDRHSVATAGGGYYKGMAAFASPRYGGMVEFGIGGQKFGYAPLEQDPPRALDDAESLVPVEVFLPP